MTVWLTDEQYRIVEEYAKKNSITKHMAIKVLVDGFYHTNGNCKTANELVIVSKPLEVRE